MWSHSRYPLLDGIWLKCSKTHTKFPCNSFNTQFSKCINFSHDYINVYGIVLTVS